MDSLKITKINIYAIIIFVFAIIGLTCFIIVAPDWSKYGWSFLKYNHIENNNIPIYIQSLRAISYFSLIVILYLSVITFNNIIKINEKEIKKVLMFSCGIFIWFFLPYLFYIQKNKKYYLDYFNYLNEENKNENIILFFSKNSYNSKHNIYYIIFSFFTFIITLVGMFFVLMPLFNITEARYDKENPKSIFIFGSLSYFTQQCNILIFLFLLIYLFFNKKKFFMNNSILLCVTSYIFIVFIVFWFILFPKNLEDIQMRYPKNIFLANTIWLHAVNPIFFILFSIYTIYINKEEPIKFKVLSRKFMTYPLLYAIYAYGLPFFTQVSIYSVLTNINPGSIPYYDDKYIPSLGDFGARSQEGKWYMIFAIIPIILFFILSLYIFWIVNKKISNKKFKKN